VSCDDDVPAILIGDDMRLRQILLNLTANAIKFTATGRVAVRLQVMRQRDPQRLDLRLSVTDTGIGIDTHHLQAILQPFEQADTETTVRFGGTGLGLAICKRIGITPDLVEDGEAALDLLASRPYDLVLMNVQMPRLDGISATRELRKMPLAYQPRVIAVTANVLDDERSVGLEAGVDEFLGKPYRAAELNRLVRATPIGPV